VPEAGKTNIKQTPEFKQAVISCLTKGYATKAIASAIHDKAINDGRYPGDSMGVGTNYDKIYMSVYDCKKAKKNCGVQTGP